MAGFRVGIDIGGTFTDIFLLEEDSGAVTIGKVLTTPQDPAQAVVSGLQGLLQGRGISPAEVAIAVHGTTLITNAIIERKGASHLAPFLLHHGNSAQNWHKKMLLTWT